MAVTPEPEEVDGTITEDPADRYPVPRSTVMELPSQSLTVTPQVDAAELVGRLDVIKEAMDTAMKADVDYGVIPGTGSKPTLLKPGAEKLGVLFQLDVQITNEKHFDPDGHLTVSSLATVYHAPTGARLGFGEGLCTTREKKYGKRKQQRTCPECNATTIFKSKKRPDGSGGKGWYCWAKKGGCGAQFPEDEDPRIVSQPEDEIDNPDLPDTWNTVIKMAEKRARVDAILAVTGASALFTQDAEDLIGDAQAATTAPTTAVEIPPFAAEADDVRKQLASGALIRICHGQENLAREAWGRVKAALNGAMPEAAAVALEIAGNYHFAAAGDPDEPDSDVPFSEQAA